MTAESETRYVPEDRESVYSFEAADPIGRLLAPTSRGGDPSSYLTSCGVRIPGVPRLDSVSWCHVIGMLGFVVGSDPRTAPTHPSRQWIGLILITVIALHRPACCAVTQRSWELGIVTLCSHRSASGVSPILRGRGGVGMCWCRTAGTPHQMPPLAPHPTLGF